MAFKLKVCGMRDSGNIAEIASLCPDYLGFIFYPGSTRYVGESFDPNILDRIHVSIQKVGVFVNESIDAVIQKMIDYQLDLVQVHGNETVEYCKELFDSGVQVMKAFGIDSTFDFSITNPYLPFCQYFLFDTKIDRFGGSGQKFNWEILKKYSNQLPLFLSGGIDLSDIEAIKELVFLNIHAIDINSKFEIFPGFKDVDKVRKFKELLC